ncbi:MAG TPA: NAD(P)/FAD-dependent oxidoreductase [Streptosporangiaceae bacterium]|nr:NAD(P)/FAD-dependent oxidoreductase [Streptosporangiaceae bacterium]
MADRVDAVVIGGGLGGLAAGATLAGAGRKVVVLEQQASPGGYAQGFQRGPYRFDASLHALNGLAPGGGWDSLYHELGIWERVRLRRLDPIYRLRLPGKDSDIVAHADWFRYETELIDHFPAEAEGIRSYLDEVLAVYHDTRRIEEDRSAHHAPAMAEFPAHYPSLVRASDQTWEQMMARHVADPLTRAALGGLWGYAGLPPAQCSALMGAGMIGSYHEYGGWFPAGGAQALSDTLTQVLRERGGTILFSQLVTRIDFENGRAAAVTTNEGIRLEADQFISNASAPGTMLELLGREHLPADYADRVAATTPSYSTFAVYLGLDSDIFAELGLGHELFLAGSADPAHAWQACQQGDWDQAAVSVTDYTGVDPGCAPRGHAVVVVSTPAAWGFRDTWGTGGRLAGYHENPRYLHLKEEVADALVARAAQELPGLDAAITYLEASTPLTNFDYTLNPHGAIEGYENSPANTGPGWLPQKTPVRNLFLAGAWTNNGGMNPAMASGVRAARLAMAERAPAHA